LLEDNLPERPLPKEPVQSGPATTLHAGLVGGEHTDLVVTQYTDRLFLAVTQVCKLGTICEVRRDKVSKDDLGLGEGVGRLVYSVALLLGQEKEEVSLLARILAERLQLTKPLVLCVGVRDLTPQRVRQLADFVISILK